MGVLENYYVIGTRNVIYFGLFVTLTIVYKMGLYAVALVLAFLTRNIKVDALNDYRYNVAIIVSTSLVLMVVCISLPPLYVYINWFDLVWGVLSFLLTSIYLGLTFIPKVCQQLSH